LYKILNRNLERVRGRVLRSVLFNQIRGETWENNKKWFQWCQTSGLEEALQDKGSTRDDTIWLESGKLREQNLAQYLGRYSDATAVRFLIHVPDVFTSIAGRSVFRSWIEGLQAMGVMAQELAWGADTRSAIESFQPSVLLTSDYAMYTEQFDWEFIRSYREQKPLVLILTASPESDGNTPNIPRLEWARRWEVSFYVSFREATYIRSDLTDWFNYGFEVLSIPFSANPLQYYYVSNQAKPLNYIFLGSLNPPKLGRYVRYWLPIVRRYRGLINGPGWGQDDLILDRRLHRLVYSLAVVGLNLHIPISVNTFSEINERTYILACSGVFQLVDRPLNLRTLFGSDDVVSADSHAEYADKFCYYLAHPEERIPYIISGLRCVYDGHTVFHRMDVLMRQVLKCLVDIGIGSTTTIN
jgi:hypothetical protein